MQPACQAAYDGDVHQLYELLTNNPKLLNVKEEHTGDTPLIAACRQGNRRAIHYLLENQADVHLTNKKGNTALHYVCQRKSHRLVPLLLHRNAAADVKNNVRMNDVTPPAGDLTNPDAPCVLLQDGETPLDIATRLKFTKIICLLKKTQ
eukprot:superscaffoldBa00009149_g23893